MDVSSSYPEISALDVEDGLVLDGELVAVDERGRPDFGLLQRRMNVTKPSTALVAQVPPVQYAVFDLLHRGKRSLLDSPNQERRAELAGLQLERPGLSVPANFTDTPGLVMAAVRQQGLEGVIANRLTSTYQPGRRSKAWIKTPYRRTALVIVAGWAPSSSNPRVLSALLLGTHDPAGHLAYVGDLGSGFSDATRRHLLDLLGSLQRDTSPFLGEFVRARGWPGRPPSRGPVHWVEPRLVGAIEYRSFTRDGSFRHPSWRGLRPDLDPHDVQLPRAD